MVLEHLVEEPLAKARRGDVGAVAGAGELADAPAVEVGAFDALPLVAAQGVDEAPEVVSEGPGERGDENLLAVAAVDIAGEVPRAVERDHGLAGAFRSRSSSWSCRSRDASSSSPRSFRGSSGMGGTYVCASGAICRR
jgi:hypothetical protein